jgi:diguanylate cyclase (GGDEF)-like protein
MMNNTTAIFVEDMVMDDRLPQPEFESEHKIPTPDELKTHPTDEAFYRYLYKNSLREKRYVSFVLAVFNLLLLIPDWMIIGSLPTKIIITVFRVLFSVLILLFVSALGHFRNFIAYSRILTVIEAFGVSVFLFVLMNYPEPDFLIQAMGMIVIILAIFMYPNRWFNMVVVSFISIAIFLLAASFHITDLNIPTFAAGAVYIMITGILCAFWARSIEEYRLRHYSSMESLRSISTTDSLTQTCNRLRLEHEGERLIRHSRAHEKPLSLVFIDLDDLKTINDKYGHIIGDKVLIETAARIRKHLSPHDIVCRWGGDEFVVVLPGADRINAFRTVERIRDSLTGEPFANDIMTSCSFGIADLKDDSTLHSLIYMADQQMYRAKRKGKNRIEFQKQTF